MDDNHNRFISEATVSEIVNLSRSTISRKVAAGSFPKPIQLTERRKAWTPGQIRTWVAERITAAAQKS
jgi:prophage regulatory protein